MPNFGTKLESWRSDNQRVINFINPLAANQRVINSVLYTSFTITFSDSGSFHFDKKKKKPTSLTVKNTSGVVDRNDV